MSVQIEGEGIFKDFNGSKDGKPVFETKDPIKWEEHCRKAKLKTSGSGPCVVCSTRVTFTDLPYGKKPVCEDCKEHLLEK